MLFSFLSIEIIFILFSFFMAVLLWIEGFILTKTAGKIPKNIWFRAASAVDTLWFFVCLFALYKLELKNIALSVPIAYCVYTIFGWFYGTVLLKNSGGIPDSIDDFVVPQKYIAYSQSFAVVFALLCLVVLFISQQTLPVQAISILVTA